MATKRGDTPGDPFLRASIEPQVLALPPFRCIAIDGRGDPEGPEFRAAVGALYGVAYTLKFAGKNSGKADFKVLPLEAIWWVGTAKVAKPSMWKSPRESWRWKAMIRMPPS